MPVVMIILVIALVAAFVWWIEKYWPISVTFKRIIQGVAVIGVAIWLLRVLGLWQMIMGVTV